MNYKLIAFDLDGTLLDSDKNLPDENLRALEKAAEKGICLVLATGRIVRAIPEKLRDCPFIRYYISANGASIYDAKEEKVICRHEISAELTLKVIKYLDTLPVLYDCYQDDIGWMSKDMFAKAEDYIKDKGILDLVRKFRKQVDDLYRMVEDRDRPVQKLQCYFKDMKERKKQLELIPKLFPGIAVSSSLKINIELNDSGADKGSALRRLCGMIGIDTAECAAFGDGTNDLTMIKAAGMGIAMKNAEAEVREAADYITENDNNHNGVAEMMYSFI